MILNHLSLLLPYIPCHTLLFRFSLQAHLSRLKIRPPASGVGSLINGESSPFITTLRLAPRRGTMGPLARYILNWIRVVWQVSGLNTHHNAGCNNHDELDIPGGESSPNELIPTPFEVNGEVLPNFTIDKSIWVVPYFLLPPNLPRLYNA